MEEPTKEQIQKYLKWVDGLAILHWTHFGDQQPDPDLVAVTEWLKSK